MTFSQKYDEIIQIVADAMRDSGRTCDEDSWPIVMASEAVNALSKAGYLCEENSADKTEI